MALAGCTGGPRNGQGSRLIEPDKRAAAPALRGEFMEGTGSFDLAEQRGNIVVINFWASWCPPCRAEARDLEAVHAATRSDGVRFVGINVRDQRDLAMAYLADVKPGYGSLFDPSSELSLDFEVPPNAIPATLVVDSKGRLAAVFRGAISRELLEPVVRDLRAESA